MNKFAGKCSKGTHSRGGTFFRALSFLMSFFLVSGAMAVSPQAATSASAATIRLSKTEGTVGVTDSAGKSVFLREDMRLSNGDHTVTGESSYAWMNLDDVKALKEDAVSDVELRKSGNKLEVLLNSGALFFNVSEPLKSDETLNIRTSTMVMGIRGTAGWTKVIDKSVTRVCLLSGKVECIVTNPINGQTKITELHAGDAADFYVYDPMRPVDQTDIIIHRFTVDETDGFVLKELRGNDPLILKILEESGLDYRLLTDEMVNARLTRDQQEKAGKMSILRSEQEGQKSQKVTDPVWEVEPDKQDTSSDSGGDHTDPAPAPVSSVIYLTMPVTAQEVQDYLDDPNVTQVILQPGSNPARNTLQVDIDFNVPEGKTLTTQSGVPVDVNADKTANVNGTADLGDALTNNGTLNVNSSNTLKAAGLITNNGSFVNTASGRTVANGGFLGNAGSGFTNSGIFQGDVTMSGDAVIYEGTLTGNVTGTSSSDGSFAMSGGAMNGNMSGIFRTINLSAGTLNGSIDAAVADRFTLDGGTVNGTASLSGAAFSLNSGAITADSADPALTIAADDLGAVAFNGGTVTNNGAGYALNYRGGAGTLTYTGGTIFRTAVSNGVVEPPIAEWHEELIGSYYQLISDRSHRITISSTMSPDISCSTTVDTVPQTAGSEFAEKDQTVALTLTNAASSWMTKVVTYSVENSSGTPLPDSTGTLTLEPGASSTFSFIMPDDEVTVNLSDEGNGQLILSLPLANGVDDVTSAMNTAGAAKVTLRAGTGNTLDIASGESLVVEPDMTLQFDEGVTVNANAGSTVTIRTGGTINNYGTFNTYGDFINNGTYNNFSGHTHNNYGTMLNLAGAVINNGNGEDSIGVLNNLSAGGMTGKIGNLGSINNRSGSSIVNEGVIVYSDAASADLSGLHITGGGGSYSGKDVGAGALGGICGTESFWCLTIVDGVDFDSIQAYDLNVFGQGDMPDYVSGTNPSPWMADTTTIAIRNAAVDGLTGIGQDAFYYAGTMQEISLSDTLESIGVDAFSFCSLLKEVDIPEGVTSIGSGAFSYCTALETVVIPEGLETLGQQAFEFCTNLSAITIPKGITSIGYYAFHNCTALQSFAIPDGVTAIGERAFESCSALTEITIPDSVESIGYAAFYGCSNLQKVTVPSSVTSLDQSVFNSCGLKEVTFYDGLTEIPSGTFANCGNLESIHIPETVTVIGQSAFSGCTVIDNIFIPKSVTTIGSDAFTNCDRLQNIHYEGTEEEWNQIDIGYSHTSGYADVFSGVTVYYGESTMPLTMTMAASPVSMAAPAKGADLTALRSEPEEENEISWELEEIKSSFRSATPSNAENTQDRTASCILHITGSGRMEDYDREDGISTAPWFEEGAQIVAVTIDKEISCIGAYSLYGLKELSYVSFGGTEEEWNSVEIGKGNDVLNDVDMIFEGEDALVLGDPLIPDDAEEEEIAAEEKAAVKATSSDAEPEKEPEKEPKEKPAETGSSGGAFNIPEVLSKETLSKEPDKEEQEADG